MTENELEATLIGELRSDGRLTPVTETQVRQYAAALAEVERLSAALSENEPGTPEAKRISSALGRAERSRDALGRALGLTDRARRERAKKHASGGRALHEFFTHEHACVLSPDFERGACSCSGGAK